MAAIEPEWVEPVAAHLVKRSYSEPRWSRSQGSAVATEKVTLYGIPIVADRTVLLHRIDPVLARELFIRHALVEGDWQTRHHFFRDNAKLIEEAASLEQRARRRGLVVGEDGAGGFGLVIDLGHGERRFRVQAEACDEPIDAGGVVDLRLRVAGRAEDGRGCVLRNRRSERRQARHSGAAGDERRGADSKRAGDAAAHAIPG